MEIERFDNYSDFKKRRVELESMKGHIVKSYCSIPKNKYRLTYMVKEGGEMKAGDRKIVCSCPVCADGKVYLIKKAEFKYYFECDNSRCQTRKKNW